MSYPQGILPVVTLDDPKSACVLADILLDEKVYQIEVVFRTAQAPAVVRTLTQQFPELLVGAGTIRSIDQLCLATEAGAKFFVSPFYQSEIALEAQRLDLDYIPGVATPTEVATASKAGFTFLKFFPSEILGGINGIKTLMPIFPEVKWFPTGGISLDKVEAYLELSAVTAVGLGAVASPQEIREGKWDLIRQRANFCGKINGRLSG